MEIVSNMVYWVIFLILVIIALIAYIYNLQKNNHVINDYNDDYFKSRQAELLFYLTKLEGKQRNKLLGLTDLHYEDKTIAKKWYREICQYAHPDKGGDERAFHVLKKIYDVLVEE